MFRFMCLEYELVNVLGIAVSYRCILEVDILGSLDGQVQYLSLSDVAL